MADPPFLPQQPPLQDTVVNNRRKPDLTEDQRKQVVSALLDGAVWDADGKPIPRRGKFKTIAHDFNVCAKTIRRVWERAWSNYLNEGVKAFRASPLKKGKCGRHRQHRPEEIRAVVKGLRLHEKRTYRSMAAALALPTTTLFDYCKQLEYQVVDPARSVARYKPA